MSCYLSVSIHAHTVHVHIWNELTLCGLCVSYRYIMSNLHLTMTLRHFLQKGCQQLSPLHITASYLEVFMYNHSPHSSATQQIHRSNLGHHYSSFSERWGGFSLLSLPNIFPGVWGDSHIPIQPCLANTKAWSHCASAHLLHVNTLSFTHRLSQTSPLLLPSGLSSCAYAGVPSTCRWAASDCRCERWNLCAWLLPPAAGRWRCSSSSARMSAASWPSARPVYRTGLGVPLPAGQTLWEIICKTYTSTQRHKDSQ